MKLGRYKIVNRFYESAFPDIVCIWERIDKKVI